MDMASHHLVSLIRRSYDLSDIEGTVTYLWANTISEDLVPTYLAISKQQKDTATFNNRMIKFLLNEFQRDDFFPTANAYLSGAPAPIDVT